MTTASILLKEVLMYHNTEHLDTFPDEKIRKALQDCVDNGYAYLHLNVHDVLPLLSGDSETIHHLPHLATRQLLGTNPALDYPLLHTYFQSIPTLIPCAYEDFVRALKPHLNLHSLQYMYSLVAERLSPEDMKIFTYEMRLFIPPFTFMDLAFVNTSIDWERFFEHEMPWSTTFLQYMEPYWAKMPYNFYQRLSPLQQEMVPSSYKEALHLYATIPTIAETLLPLDNPEDGYTLEQLHQLYAMPHEFHEEIPLTL